MITFNPDSIVVTPTIGDVLAFGRGRNQQGQDIYYVNYSQFIKAPDSIAVKNDWNSWHNHEAKTPGFDTLTLVDFSDAIKFNRLFAYAPYSGVSISTWPNKDMRFNIKVVADEQFQQELAKNDFLNNNNGKFVEVMNNIYKAA